jgi:hypothetical protein
MRTEHRRLIRGRAFGLLILLGVVAYGVSGCGPDYGYYGYPGYGYAPYSYSWVGRGYDPVFVVHHPWEDHHGDGHHTEFYHAGGAIGHAGGNGFHGGGGGGGHGGGGGGHR